MLVFSPFIIKLKYVYWQKDNSLISLKWQTHVTITYNNDMIVIYPMRYKNSDYVQYSFLY
jgi:hypothetical protein